MEKPLPVDITESHTLGAKLRVALDDIFAGVNMMPTDMINQWTNVSLEYRQIKHRLSANTFTPFQFRKSPNEVIDLLSINLAPTEYSFPYKNYDEIVYLPNILRTKIAWTTVWQMPKGQDFSHSSITADYSIEDAPILLRVELKKNQVLHSVNLGVDADINAEFYFSRKPVQTEADFFKVSPFQREVISGFEEMITTTQQHSGFLVSTPISLEAATMPIPYYLANINENITYASFR